MLSNLDIDVREGVERLLADNELIDICDTVLVAEGVTRPCYVSVSMVSDAEMRDINTQWRGIDAVTDVISLECERPDDPGLAEEEPCELGDIVLAPAYITEQSATFGTTPADECRLLFVHGLLHLLGYDHLEDAEAEEMEAHEDAICAIIKNDGSLMGVHVTRHQGDEQA